MSDTIKPCPLCGSCDLQSETGPGIQNGPTRIYCNQCDAGAPIGSWQGRAEPAVNVQVTGSLDEIDAPVWPFIHAEAVKVGAARGRIESYRYEQGCGGVVVLWDRNSVHAMAVTIRDDLNRTRCVRVLAAAPAFDPVMSISNEKSKACAKRGRDAIVAALGTPGLPQLSAERSKEISSKTRAGYLAYADELWGGDPNCQHDVQCAPGGGIKCTKCGAWCCY